MTYTEIDTDEVHGLFVRISGNDRGWYMAQVDDPGSPIHGMAQFATTPLRARAALRATIDNCQRFGTAGLPPGTTGALSFARPIPKRRRRRGRA